jgi:hypothetical protein
MDSVSEPGGKPRRGRASVKDCLKLTLDHGKPLTQLPDHTAKEEILTSVSGRAGKPLPHQATVEN